MGMAGASAGLGLGGDILGGIKGQNSLNQDNAGLNASVNAEQGGINNLEGLSKSIVGTSLPDISTIFQQLLNYQPLTQVQTNALTSGVTKGGENAVNTFKSDVGGVANPAKLIQQLFTQNAQGGDSTALQLGSEVANDKLGALTGAGQLAGNTLSTGVGAAGSALGAQSGISNLYASAAQSQGNPWGQALSGASSTLGTLGGMKG